MIQFNPTKRVIATLILLSFFSCFLQTKRKFSEDQFLMGEMIHENENSETAERVELGKKLFFDPILSVDSTLSCASCHIPEFAFSDTQKFSPGVFGRPGVRNAPSLMNIGLHPYYLREGSVPTIEMQVLIPIQEKNEFDHNIVEISKKLILIEDYKEMSEKAYNRPPDHYVITRALGVYQRTLVSNQSKFDQYLNEKSDLTKQEKRGMNLFFGKAKCSKCHNGFNFTNYKLSNNGLYKNYTDIGRMRVSNDSNDLAQFKTPSLRNVEVTAPYMHDGSKSTLMEVVKHYNSGGEKHRNKDILIEPLNLNEKEMESLVSFLGTLTDSVFKQNP